MNNKEAELIDDLANSYLKTKAQESNCTVRLGELITEAKSKLKKKSWKSFLKDSRVNLKYTQARKFMAVSEFCKAGVQSTELFQKEGIEKTFILSQVEDEELKEKFIKFLLKNPLSTRHLKQILEIVVSENISIEEALERLKSKERISKPKEGTVSITEFLQLKQEMENLKKKLEMSEKELLDYKRKSLKTDSSKTNQNSEKQESDHFQPSLLVATS